VTKKEIKPILHKFVQAWQQETEKKDIQEYFG
jgi:hypothetical protein